MDVVQHVQDMTGLQVDEKPWNRPKGIPRYFTGGRNFSILTVDGQDFLLIKENERKFNAENLMNDSLVFREKTGLPVVYFWESVSPYQKKTLISNHINYVTYKENFYLSSIPVLSGGKSLPKTMGKGVLRDGTMPAFVQTVWLYTLYSNHPLQQSQIAKGLKTSPGNVSVAISTLKDAGLITKTKEGRKTIIELATTESQTRYDLLMKSWTRMRSPVIKTNPVVYHGTSNRNLLEAGETALAKRTLLGYPEIDFYAADHIWLKHNQNDFDLLKENDEILPENAFILETWRYNPIPLAAISESSDMADPISVALSLRDNPDERVSISIENNLHEVLGK